MVDSNLQREEILPSEKAFAYKMKYDAMRRKAGRPSKNNSSQFGRNFQTDIVLAEQVGESRGQLHRYLRLVELLRILNENAPLNENNRFQKITLTKNKLREFFPAFYTKSQMENVLFKLLEDWKMENADTEE